MYNSISNKKMDQVMSRLLDNRDMTNADLTNLASDRDSFRAMEMLKAMKAIDYHVAYGGKYLYGLRILDEGILYFYRKRQERAGFWKGFLTGILSTAAASILVNILLWAVTSTS